MITATMHVNAVLNYFKQNSLFKSIQKVVNEILKKLKVREEILTLY